MPKKVNTDLEKFYKILAKEIKEIRKQKKITQSQAANKLGIALVSYQRYEQGRHRIDIFNMFKLAEALDVSPPVLFMLARKAYEQVMNMNKDKKKT